MSLASYFQAPEKKTSSSTKRRNLLIGSGFVCALLLSGSVFAANISLSSGNVEFGQGTTTATACDSQVLVTAQAKVDNAMFFLDTVTVSNIDKAACNGKDLSVFLNLDIGNQDMLGVAKFALDGSGSTLDPVSGSLTFTADGQDVSPPSNAVAVTSGTCNNDGCSVVLTYTNIPSSALKKILLETSQ